MLKSLVMRLSMPQGHLKSVKINVGKYLHKLFFVAMLQPCLLKFCEIPVNVFAELVAANVRNTSKGRHKH